MSSKTVGMLLSNEFRMPVIGLGTWKSSQNDVSQAVIHAIDAGYRYIDCAFIYGNECEIGEALKVKFEDESVRREDLFITSKLWSTFHSSHLVLPAIKESLKSLRLDYLDLYLIHWPMGFKEGGDYFPRDQSGKVLYSDVDYIETWQAMEECVKAGLTRGIGVSNFNKDQIERILAMATVPLVNVQVESHPYLDQKRLREFCRSKNISFTAYSPLGSPSRPWATADDPQLMEEPNIKDIAKKHSKTTAQVLIRYQIQLGASVIPKSVSETRIQENIKVFDFELDSDDMKVLQSFNCGARALHLSWASDHKYFPFNAEF